MIRRPTRSTRTDTRFPYTTRCRCAEVEKVSADPAVAVKSDPDATASDASPLRPDVVAAVTKAVHARAPGLPIIPSMSAGATDSLYFRAVGVPSYEIGRASCRERVCQYV